MSTHRCLPLLLAALTACQTTQVRLIDEPLLDAGHALGDAMAELPFGAEDAPHELRTTVNDVGDALVRLVLTHEDTEVPFARVPSDLVYLDEPVDNWLAHTHERLDAHYVHDRPAPDTVYDVDLEIVWSREVVHPDGTTHRVWEPPALRGTFDLLTATKLDGEPVDLRIRADFETASVDGDGCADGGRIDVSYRLVRDGVDLGDNVAASWHGCDRVQIHTTRVRTDLYPHDGS
jgi:hypothetical protein